MYKALIIEDEVVTAKRLSRMITSINNEFEITATISTIESCVQWLKQNGMPHVIFMDIHLADGNSFEIFKRVNIDCPVIFTTAYDQYAIQAFKVNGLDYLLKPIESEALKQSLERLQQTMKSATTTDELISVLSQVQKQQAVYRNRFLVSFRDNLLPVPVSDIAYFVSEFKITYIVTFKANKYAMEQTLEELEAQLNPDDFFRATRQLILSQSAIKKISQFFNGRLKLTLEPSYNEEVLVSRDKSNQLKEWLNK